MQRFTRISIKVQPLTKAAALRPFSTQTIRMADNDNSAIDANKGSIGSKFQPDGEIGGKAQEVGGPFDKEGGRQTSSNASHFTDTL